jgi:hypothetical protein
MSKQLVVLLLHGANNNDDKLVLRGRLQIDNDKWNLF